MPEEETNLTSSMTDIAYMINCKTLPYDHAFKLSNQITMVLPWLNDNLQNGIHMLHGPHAGHGWERSTDDTIFLSKRTRLILRIPKTHIDRAKKLEGVTLKISNDTFYNARNLNYSHNFSIHLSTFVQHFQKLV